MNMKSIFLTIIFALFVSSVFAQTENPLFVVIVDDKRGYIDKTGKIVIQPQWGGAGDFSEGLAKVATYEDGYAEGYIDTTGKVVIPLRYKMAQDFSEGLAAVGFGQFGLHNSGDHKTGFIDKTGKLVIKPKFRDAIGFSEGLARVYDNGKYGFIDKTGNVVIPLQFEEAGSFSEDLACVKIGDKFGFIDKTGKVVIEPKYLLPSAFSEGLASVTIGGKASKGGYGGYYITDKGKPVFIDKTGKIVIQFGDEVTEANGFSEGLAAIQVRKDAKNVLTGFIDTSGKLVIPPKYYNVAGFSEGLASFIHKGKWTYLNKKGEIVFSTGFDLADNFENGLAWIQKGKFGDSTLFEKVKYGYIDKTGKVIWTPTK